MLEEAFTISLLNLTNYVLFSEGYIFHFINIMLSNWIDNVFGLKMGAKIMMPIFNCYVCMSSFWTAVWCLIGWDFHHVLALMLLVCAMSYIIERLIRLEDA